MKKNFFTLVLYIHAVLFSASVFAYEPTETEESTAFDYAKIFITALENQNFEQAYSMLTSSRIESTPFEEWRAINANTLNSLGKQLELTQTKVTWYKDPRNAREPGIYTVFDFSCKYENTAFCTKMLILHKLEGDSFKVMQHETSFVDLKTTDSFKQNQDN